MWKKTSSEGRHVGSVKVFSAANASGMGLSGGSLVQQLYLVHFLLLVLLMLLLLLLVLLIGSSSVQVDSDAMSVVVVVVVP